MPEPRTIRPACRNCDGSGREQVEVIEDGFDRSFYQQCQRCAGDGYEPQAPEIEEEDDGQQ